MPPAPKHPSVRQRTNRSSSARVIDVIPKADPPALPDAYHANSKMWWRVIWSSPISDEWVDADLPGLIALAQLVDDFWKADAVERAKRHAEVRMASREYGLSPMSRRSLQWEVRRVEAATPTQQPRERRTSKTVLAALQGGKTG